MHKLVKKYKNYSGMTLVEVLTAMLILGIIIVAIFPLITQSLQVTNLSHNISAQLFGEQEEVEIVAITEDGAYLEDGTFIPVAYFPVVANGSINWVPGKTVKKADLVRFLADNQVSSYNLFEVYEGYTSEEATLTIVDKSLTADSELEITDQSNTSFNESELSAVITPGEDITFTLPTNSSRFTNLQSPYIIKVTTGETEKSGMLLVHLPRAVIANDTGGLLVASSPYPGDWFAGGSSNWVSRTSSISSTDDINKIIFAGTSESEARFIAIGKNGSIYSWQDGETVFAKLTSGVSADLNDIISTNYGLLVVGNNGVILQSSDGETWNTRTSGTTADLNAITYNDSTKQYVCAGSNGIILTSANTSSWTKISASSYPATGSTTINSKDTVTFSSSGDYMKTDSNPVTGSSYTVFMVVKPSSTPTNVSFLSLGPASSSFTLRTSGTNLAAETKSAGSTSSFNSTDSNLALSTGAAIIACRVSGTSIGLYKNGTKQTGTIPTSVTPGSAVGMQLGSSPLTNYTNPMPFDGSIAEVMVFNSALSTTRPNWKYWGTTYSLASEMDIVQKYLSVKYNIGIASDINDLRYNGSAATTVSRPYLNSLTTINGDWRTFLVLRWPYGYNSSHPNYTMDPVLWLDIWSSGSKDTLTRDGNKVLEWKNTAFEDLTDASSTIDANFPPKLIANMKSVACSDSTHFYAGGDHRNLILYNGTTVIQDPEILNNSTGKAIQYSIDDMLFDGDRFIALLNDDLGSSNKYIATLDRPGNYTDVKVISSYTLNDIFHYTTGDTLLVTGNNGTIFYADGSAESWTSKTLSGNLLAACLR